MLLLPAISALFTFVYLRPQEVFELLHPVTLAWMLGAVALGWILDVRLGLNRVRGSRLLVLALVFFIYCIVTTGIKAPDRIVKQIIALLPSLMVFFFVAQGLPTLRALGAGAAVLLMLTLVVCAVAVDQGFSPSICYYYAESPDNPDGELEDGRPCETATDCRESEGALASREYICERPGLFDTHSVTKRVRFRGLLEDPNELSWVVAMALPLAFAAYELRRSWRRLTVLIVALALGSACVVMSKSRSGQLSLAAVFAVYFVRRFGWRIGALVAAVASFPVLLLGGRGGVDAESSSAERLECWSEALSLWRENPIFGVGQGQFTEHHYLTAHNSFLLTVAELGPLGLFLFSLLLYLAFKITIRAQLDFRSDAAAASARVWASALLAALVGMLVSAFFLSIAYHAILWIFIGLVGAVEAAIRIHDPGWKVRFSWRDLTVVALADVGIVAAVFVYLRLKGV